MTTTDYPNNRLGLYIHIPFCIRKCLYCDFCSYTDADGGVRHAYAEELCRRIAELSEPCRGYTVDTVYFGGGTPTLLDIGDICRIAETVMKSYRIDAECEISCECNPATGGKEYFRELRGYVNRLSIGLQSFSERELAALGRIHSTDDFLRTYGEARDAGFDNISVDLMYGIPEQSVGSFAATLEKTVGIAPEHISAYGLKVEDSTPFGKMRASLSLPDEDDEFEMYRLCTEILGGAGYEKYEISNFAQPGRESRHNLRYWLGDDYIGFGPAAHSYFRGERFSCSRDIEAFMRGEDIVDCREKIEGSEIMNEYVMLRMRLSRGVDTADFISRFGRKFTDVYPGISKYVTSGHVLCADGHFRFSDKGFFISNYVLSDILDFC